MDELVAPGPRPVHARTAPHDHVAALGLEPLVERDGVVVGRVQGEARSYGGNQDGVVNVEGDGHIIQSLTREGG